MNVSSSHRPSSGRMLPLNPKSAICSPATRLIWAFGRLCIVKPRLARYRIRLKAQAATLSLLSLFAAHLTICTTATVSIGLDTSACVVCSDLALRENCLRSIVVFGQKGTLICHFGVYVILFSHLLEIWRLSKLHNWYM